MKFMKLIKANDNSSKNKKNNIRTNIELFSYLERKFIIKIDEVNIWDANLYLIGKLEKSSIKLTIITGKEINGIIVINEIPYLEISIMLKIIVININPNPPPVGVFLMWELLSLGLSIKYFEKLDKNNL